MTSRPGCWVVASLVVFICCASAAAAPLKKVELKVFPGRSVALTLPAARQATLTADAKLLLGGKTLVLDADKKLEIRRYHQSVEGNRVYFVLEYKQTYPQETERLRVSMYNVPGKTNLALRSSIHIAAVDLDKAEVLWQTDLLNMQCEGGWEMLDSPELLFVRTLTAAYAVGKTSGRLRWLLDHDALQSSGNDRYLLAWKVVDQSFVFDVVHRVDYDPAKQNATSLEIDIESGERVFRATPPPKAEPVPVYVYSRQDQEYPGDRPAPALPKDFDGIRLERTLLLWNKKTHEGVIVNPQKALVPRIVELASKQVVDGKQIEWKLVIDLFGAIRTFGKRQKTEVLAGHKDQFMGDDEILLESPGDLASSGEKIAAAEVASKLHAATLGTPPPEKSSLQAAPLFVYRDKEIGARSALPERDYPFNLKLKWGPYVIHERTYDRPYLKMEN